MSVVIVQGRLAERDLVLLYTFLLACDWIWGQQNFKYSGGVRDL
jgi:hypothetical protein